MVIQIHGFHKLSNLYRPRLLVFNATFMTIPNIHTNLTFKCQQVHCICTSFPLQWSFLTNMIKLLQMRGISTRYFYDLALTRPIHQNYLLLNIFIRTDWLVGVYHQLYHYFRYVMPFIRNPKGFLIFLPSFFLHKSSNVLPAHCKSLQHLIVLISSVNCNFC